VDQGLGFISSKLIHMTDGECKSSVKEFQPQTHHRHHSEADSCGEYVPLWDLTKNILMQSHSKKKKFCVSLRNMITKFGTMLKNCENHNELTQALF
jgi:hypothetical protein